MCNIYVSSFIIKDCFVVVAFALFLAIKQLRHQFTNSCYLASMILDSRYVQCYQVGREKIERNLY